MKSEKVDELYGKEALQYYSQNEVERKALSEGREIIVRQGYVLKGVFPVKPTSDCLRCHYNVS